MTDEPNIADLARLELRPLYAFGYLLTGDRVLAARLARDALAGPIGETDDHRPASVIRARVARSARRARISVHDDEPILDALSAMDARARVVMVCSIHERLSSAETAFIAGCSVEAVEQLLASAVSSAARSLDVSEATSPGMVRMGMMDLVGSLGELPEVRAGVTGPGQRWRIVAAASLVLVAGGVVLAAGRRAAPAAAERGPEVFTGDRSGYRLTVPEAWRALPTVATGAVAGVDPSRLGLATMDPADDTMMFIPRAVRRRSALLRITVTPSISYDDEVARFRDAVSARQRSSGAVVTAARDTVARRPATRFRFDRLPEDEACPRCRSMIWIVHWRHGTTMTVDLTIFGADEQLLDEGWAIVRSIEPAHSPLRYLPARGEVADGMTSDEHLETLLQFMDARARGSGAEVWLGDGAEVEPRLLGGVARYRVRLRSTSPDEATFTVEVSVADRFGRRRTIEERIRVGPGARFGAPWPSVVLGLD